MTGIMLQEKGFTLMELLVAATIISILLVFATVNYRNSAAETRWEQAKARLSQVTNAIQRAELDYDGVTFIGKLDNLTSSSHDYTCALSNQEVSTNELILCGYLENTVWDDNYFEYYGCSSNNDNVNCKTGMKACVKVAPGAKVPAGYLSYMYCESSTGRQEYK